MIVVGAILLAFNIAAILFNVYVFRSTSQRARAGGKVLALCLGVLLGYAGAVCSLIVIVQAVTA